LIISYDHVFKYAYSSIFELLYVYGINFLYCFPKQRSSGLTATRYTAIAFSGLLATVGYAPEIEVFLMIHFL